MKATNVEELIILLESFEGEQLVSSGEINGKRCILIHDEGALPGSYAYIQIPPIS